MSDQEKATALADLDALFAERGVTITAAGVQAARERRYAVERAWTPRRWAALRDRVRRDIEASDPGAHRGTSAA